MNYTLLESSAPRSVTITVPFTTWYKVYMAGPGGKSGLHHTVGSNPAYVQYKGGGAGGGGFGATLRLFLNAHQQVRLTSSALYVQFVCNDINVTAYAGQNGGPASNLNNNIGSGGAGGYATHPPSASPSSPGRDGKSVCVTIPHAVGDCGATGGLHGTYSVGAVGDASLANAVCGIGGAPRGEAFPFGLSERRYGHGAGRGFPTPGKGAILFMLAP